MSPLRAVWLLRPHLLPVGRHPKGSYQNLHTKPNSRAATTTAARVKDSAPQSVLSSSLPQVSKPIEPPLSLLPASVLVRSYLIAALSSSPRLLTPALRFLSILSSSQSILLSHARNPIIGYVLKKTLYAHFCAGENREEIRATLLGLKRLGYKGVALGYAREILLGEKEDNLVEGSEDDLGPERSVEIWKQGNLETVRLLEDGDFVALKFTGAGPHTLQQLTEGLPPTNRIEDAMTEICNLAEKRGVGILIDAEQYHLQTGVDKWMLRYQKQYNKEMKGKAVVYGTYQAYLQSTPKTLAQHLAIAWDEGFVLGVKLVRGAYMGSDAPYIWTTKEQTDRTYDGIAKALLRREFNDTLSQPEGLERAGFHEVNLFLATHNQESVRKAMAIQDQRSQKGQVKTELAFGQLMGMADEISCELIMAGHLSKEPGATEKVENGVPKAYKYLPWGTLSECMMYLVRRAEENRDSVQRTEEGFMALKREIRRRFFRRPA